MTTPSSPYYLASDFHAQRSPYTSRYSARRMQAPRDYELPGPPSVPYREIKLTYGLVAYVSPDRYEEIAKMTWHARWNKNTHSYYAATNIKGPDGGYISVSMHRFLLGLQKGDLRIADHRDMEHTLNNTTDFNGIEGNLRILSQIDSIRHRTMYKCNKTGFTGVNPYPWGAPERYTSKLRVDRKLIHLGVFDSAAEAARVRDRAAIKHFGK